MVSLTASEEPPVAGRVSAGRRTSDREDTHAGVKAAATFSQVQSSSGLLHKQADII